MTGFKGSYRHIVDQKGRISIPARFRSTPGVPENFVITLGMNGCLYVFPIAEWAKVEEKLRGLARNDPRHQYYLRMTYSSACDVQTDSQGRITIPPNLMKMAKLGREVLVNGVLDRIEIWNPELFQKYIDECPESYEEVASKILI